MMRAHQNAMRREALKALGDRAGVGFGTVTSYDAVNGVVKIMLEPQGFETNWLQLPTLSAGAGYGMVMGPEIGTQACVGFERGSVDSAAVLCFLHDDVAPRPTGPTGGGPPAGATWIYDKAGTALRLTGGGKMAIDASATVAAGPVHSTSIVSSGAAPSGVITTTTGAVCHVQNGSVTVAAGQLVNTVYFDAIAARLLVAETCDEVQGLVNDAFAQVAQLQNDITAQLAALQPYLDLLSVPKDLAGLIKWVSKVIAIVLGPQAAAYLLMVEQEAALAAQIPKLAEAAAEAAKRCVQITVPTLPGVTLPTIPGA